jgi:hypothetical protein
VIVGLADDSDLSASELCPQLQKMCESEVWTYNEPSEYGELLRWEDLLANLDSGLLYGLIKLSGFWQVGSGLLMLHRRASRAEPLPEHDYHSASNYDHVIREHAQWLKDELAALK